MSPDSGRIRKIRRHRIAVEGLDFSVMIRSLVVT